MKGERVRHPRTLGEEQAGNACSHRRLHPRPEVGCVQERERGQVRGEGAGPGPVSEQPSCRRRSHLTRFLVKAGTYSSELLLNCFKSQIATSSWGGQKGAEASTLKIY